MSNTPNNEIPYVPENTIDPAAGLNEALRVIDTLLQLRIVSITNTLPATPADGARYLVGTSPTGAAVGHSGEIATYNSVGNYYFFDNANYALLGTVLYVNNGSNVWAASAGGGITSVNGDAGPAVVLDATDVGAEPTVVAGTSAQYWNGSKVWTDFATTVRGAVLAGYVAGTMTAIAATDTVLQAFAKVGAYLAALGTAAFKNTGTSGNTVPLLDGANTWSATQTLDANLVMTGVGARIQGDFTAATITDRAALQTSVVNGNTTMVLMPNGTSTIANLTIVDNPTGPGFSRFILGVNGTLAECTISSTNVTGGGTILPIKMQVGGLQSLTLSTSGSATFGGPVIYPTYTVATMPSAAANTRGMIYVSNMAGGAECAFSDGVNWRRNSDRIIAS